MITPQQLAKPGTEHAEQTALFCWIAQTKNETLAKTFAIPNGGERNMIVASRLKAEGVKPGVPDIMLPVPRRGYCGLFIEMKKRTKYNVSAEQKDRLTELNADGYYACVCLGWEQASATLLWYIADER